MRYLLLSLFVLAGCTVNTNPPTQVVHERSERPSVVVEQPRVVSPTLEVRPY